MKKVIIIILAVVMTLCMTLCMCACSDNSKFCTLEKAYKKGIITKDDVIEIGCFYNKARGFGDVYEMYTTEDGRETARRIEFDENKDLPTISEDEIAKIKNDVYDEWSELFDDDNFPDFLEIPKEKEEKIEKLISVFYYGTYNGYYAVLVDIFVWEDQSTYHSEIIIDNINFGLSYGTMYMYRIN